MNHRNVQEPPEHRVVVFRPDPALPGGPYAWGICKPRRALKTWASEKGYPTAEAAQAAGERELAELLNGSLAGKRRRKSPV